ncbi:hypothetical protein [Actinomadura hibisca]|uniref:hypothetical protein n=1 Tax=Actinomadura hibisca TaxID=68565 RepID=UPI00082D0C35|nr:hypothetical protein [Actinomadura hibisca]
MSDAERIAQLERDLARLQNEREVFEREATASQVRAARAVSIVFAAFDRAMSAHGFLNSTRRQLAALAGEELTRAGEIVRGQDLPDDEPGPSPGKEGSGERPGPSQLPGPESPG